ncbi:sigma-70 family RNA polymerase sigma factor [Patescibacteria group bacterium]|nr:sigma-70 family RNA polymerase sigma factor [Patescibacteria group bacterium]MCL5010303.1 sigma-70 family RNA polymerase sigma factor [Patescibacteria group bacterium]
MDSDLKKLIEKAREGDNEAFGKIYDLFLSRIYRYIYFSIRNREAAEDLTQETFLRCWKNISSFSQKRGSFVSFLFTIARNITIDWTRKKKQVSLELVEDHQLADNIEIDKNVIRQEENQLLLKALSKLKEKEKNIIILRFFEELSFAEIGRIVGKKEATVRVSLHRILKVMREEIINHEN